MEQNIFDFASLAGEEIFGIIGANTFRNYTLHIDYEKEKLVFMQDQDFKPNPKRFSEVPTDFFHHKPFFMANYSSSAGNTEMIKLLVDTGANIPILIQRDSNTISKFDGKLIPGIIAVGLGGDLRGFVGKTRFLGIDDFGFAGVLTNYQVIDTSLNKNFMNERNGIVGNPLLSRFDIILDYVKGKMYLSPNRFYKKRFKYDKSGLQVITVGENLSDFMIYDVFPGTPAAEAGLQAGDQIIGINGLNASFYKIQHLNSKFQRRSGKKVKLKILRNATKHKIVFFLRDIL